MATSRAKTRSASLEFSRDLVFYDDSPAQRKFKQQFGAEIDEFVVNAFDAHLALDEAVSAWPRKHRRAHFIRLFLHTALQNLYVSMHLTVSGYPLPAGHQLRCHFESLAISFLLHIDAEWRRFEREMDKYPAHDAISRVTRKAHAKYLREKLSLSPEWWQLVTKISKHYNHHSHSGLIAALHSFKGEWPGKGLVGGEYDPARRPGYLASISLASAGARNLAGITRSMAHEASNLVP